MSDTVSSATDRLHVLAAARISGDLIKGASVIESLPDGSIFLSIEIAYPGVPSRFEVLPLEAFHHLAEFVDRAAQQGGPVIDTTVKEYDI